MREAIRRVWDWAKREFALKDGGAAWVTSEGALA